MNGSVQEKTFRAGESFSAADVSKTEMTFMYAQNHCLVFMDLEKYDEQRVPKEIFENVLLIKEGDFGDQL